MPIWKLSIPLILLSLFLACGEENVSKFYSIKLGDSEKKFKTGSEISVDIASKKNLKIDSVNYFLDNETLETQNGKLKLGVKTLGTHKVKAIVYSEGKEITLEEEILILAASAPEIFTYEIINTYPHDITAFTQGLEFVGDTLYESTGIKGESSLRKVDYRTGKILNRVNLEPQLFGEGITILGDTLYMLTWQSGNGYLFDPISLKPLGSFNYGDSKEGWGFCNDGKTLFKSDGTQRIWKLNPDNLQETGYIETVTNSSVFNKTNELEYVDGKIYANVWQKPSMMIIDAVSGAIEGVINFGGLDKKVTQHQQLDVLNGIAYHPERKTFFVTGKRWDKLFEVRIVKREP